MKNSCNLMYKGFDFLNILLMGLILFICIYPLYYMFIYTISSPEAAARGLIFLPKEVTLENYLHVFKSGDIVNGFIVSAARAIIGTVFTVLGSSAFAYLIIMKDMPFKKFMYRFLIMTMYLSAGLIPWYMVMVSYGLKNNYLLYVLP